MEAGPTSKPSSLPAFLATDFDEHELAAQPDSIVVIDPAGSILWTNEAWARFAEANGAGAAWCSWTSYFDPIQPRELRELYVRAFEEALESGVPFEQDYECSSPEIRRHYHLRALPIKRHGFVVEHSLISTAPLLSSEIVAVESGEPYVDARGIIVQCANCRRVYHPPSSAWHWVVRCVSVVDRRVSHGICATCAGFYWAREAHQLRGSSR